jgi:hypothetical protein
MAGFSYPTLARERIMEHRCGTRVPISLTVRLVLPSRSISARIENVSLSGAFIEVGERIPEQTQLIVELAKEESGMTPPWRIPGHVVRETAAGIGIEWSSFAPWAVLSLLRRNSVYQQFSGHSDATTLSERKSALRGGSIQHHDREGALPVTQTLARSWDRGRPLSRAPR